MENRNQPRRSAQNILQSPERRSQFVGWMFLYLVLDCSWLWVDSVAYRFSDQYISNLPTLHGVGGAPQQYRIAIVTAASWLGRFHIGMNPAFMLFDMVSIAAVAAMLYLLIERAGLPAAKLTAARAFLGLWLLFFIHESFYLARPETFPSCLYVALSLLLISNFIRAESLLATTGNGVALVLLALLQGFIRADVSVVLMGSLCAAALLPDRASSQRPHSRFALSMTGALGACVSGGVLLYLMKVRYPNAHYGGAVIALQQNFGFGYPFAFLCFIAPVAFALWRMARNTTPLDVLQRCIGISAAVYLVLWSVMGRWIESRIFVPFAIALLPWLCVQLASFFSQEGDETLRPRVDLASR